MVAIYGLTTFTGVEKNTHKPFNPILGETFEFTTKDIECVSEQVSHHPPITAMHVRNKTNNWNIWLN